MYRVSDGVPRFCITCEGGAILDKKLEPVAMSEVEARIDQLRHAADRMRQSSRRIADSVQSSADALDSMVALGAGTPELQQHYLAFRARMTEWSDTLDRFADRLTDAADDISGARDGSVLPFYVNMHLRRRRIRAYMPERAAPVAAAPAPVLERRLTPDGYVSQRNHALYEQWSQRKDDLGVEQAELAVLVETRDLRAADLAALKNRLHSQDPDVDVNTLPYVMARENDLAMLDEQIAAAQNRVDVMQARVDGLESRLLRVAPGNTADAELLAGLEFTASPAWLSENTFDCVQHVVGKFHVPPVLAVDAHLWDDMARQYAHYGVTVGEVPLEGSVLLLDTGHSWADPVNGHVAYVEQVIDGEVWITDNYHPDDPVKLSDLTAETSGENVRYLYFPWHTVG
ncbi:MAG: CHAP domain-containing protein [Chloroflexota bacterium]